MNRAYNCMYVLLVILSGMKEKLAEREVFKNNNAKTQGDFCSFLRLTKSGNN